jgi:group I intron endonuclease
MEKIKMEDNKWCVYMHTNKINNKVYVGITSRNPEERWGNRGNNYTQDKQPVFYNAIQKYGWDGFEHIIFAENLTEFEAKQMEIKLIALYQTNCRRYKNPELGYNMTDGGDGTVGRLCTEETKRKISDKAKGRKFTEELKRKYSILFSKQGNPFYGKVHTEETKKILSKLRSIPVIQLSLTGEYIREFSSGKEASKILGIDEGTINDCCLRKPHCKSGGGYIWVYKKDYHPDMNICYQNEHFVSVVQLDKNDEYITEYFSIKAASQATNTRDTGIIMCCRGKYKTSGGFKWMYKEDWEEMQGAKNINGKN